MEQPTKYDKNIFKKVDRQGSSLHVMINEYVRKCPEMSEQMRIFDNSINLRRHVMI